MQTAGKDLPITVELQDVMSYSKAGLIGIVSIIAIVLIAVIVALIVKAKKNAPAPVPRIAPENKVRAAKEKYNRLLMDLETRYEMGKVSEKEAYQELSKYIRHFVHDVTGIKVQNCTLEDIGRLNMPMLYYLIAECYAPEFSADASGNLGESIRKAREVIYGWN